MERFTFLSLWIQVKKTDSFSGGASLHDESMKAVQQQQQLENNLVPDKWSERESTVENCS